MLRIQDYPASIRPRREFLKPKARYASADRLEIMAGDQESVLPRQQEPGRLIVIFLLGQGSPKDQRLR
jgi:hypothetical protein